MTDKQLRVFYELCQVYRHIPVSEFKQVRDAYDVLVDYVNALIKKSPDETQSEDKK